MKWSNLSLIQVKMTTVSSAVELFVCLQSDRMQTNLLSLSDNGKQSFSAREDPFIFPDKALTV
ncbi:hypothetical protein [Bacillus smithii]|uniref:hypothetical protein n=1 Tax=Bacillus smithii TaxID=1479 RepID=UPI003D1DF71B